MRQDRSILRYVDSLEEKCFELGFIPVDSMIAVFQQFSNPVSWQLPTSLSMNLPEEYMHRRSCLIRIKYFAGYDLKTLWEEWQFRAVLLMVYLLMSSEKSDEALAVFTKSITRWVKGNPFRWGVHWISPMESAIRVANISCCVSILESELEDVPELKKLVSRQLALHGEFIWHNQEIKKTGLTTNHTTANYAGLIMAALALPEYPKSEQWLKESIEGLVRCIGEQIYPDGGSFEGSTRYHLYVLDILAHTVNILNKAGKTVPEELRDGLCRMFNFMFGIMDCKGHVPRIGDNDSRMWLSPSRVSSYSFLRVLTGADRGSELFSRIEDNWFTDSGIARISRGDFTVLLSVVPLGQKGLAGHNHEDVLQLNASVNSIPFLVDPGTGTYSCNLRDRNAYRIRENHGVPYIDGNERYLNFSSIGPFDIDSHLPFMAGIDPPTGIPGTCEGFIQFDSHRISRKASITGVTLQVVDKFTMLSGLNGKTAVSQFLVSPEWEVSYHEGGDLVFNRAGTFLRMRSSGKVSLRDGVYSREYGESGKALMVSCREPISETGCRIVTEFTLLASSMETENE